MLNSEEAIDSLRFYEQQLYGRQQWPCFKSFNQSRCGFFGLYENSFKVYVKFLATHVPAIEKVSGSKSLISK